MDDVGMLIGWNVILAIPLAILVAAMSCLPGLRSRPAVCHVLWLLVLCKLVTPPVVPIALLPSQTVAESQSTEAHSTEAVTNGSARPEVQAPSGLDTDLSTTRGASSFNSAPASSANAASLDHSSSSEVRVSSRLDAALEFAYRNRLSIGFVLLLVGLLGTVFVVSSALLQASRLGRLIRGMPVSNSRVAQTLKSVSQQLEIRQEPRLMLVDAAVPPMLWGEPTRPAILMSRRLAEDLGEEELRHVVAHELAHYVRWDHWANGFAFLVTALMWWNPVAWIARQAMRQAAEASCDALALERAGLSRKTYAQTLLKVVDYLERYQVERPSLAVTFGESGSIRRRFEMIADKQVKARISPLYWGLLGLTVSFLLWHPVRGQEDSSASQPDSKAGVLLFSDFGLIESEPEESNPQSKKAASPKVGERAHFNFDGNRFFSDSLLSKVPDDLRGDDSSDLGQEVVSRIEEAYREYGFFDVQISLQREESYGAVAYVVHIEEGTRARIRTVRFKGNELVSQDQLGAATAELQDAYITPDTEVRAVNLVKTCYRDSGNVVGDIRLSPTFLEGAGELELKLEIAEIPSELGAKDLPIEQRMAGFWAFEISKPGPPTQVGRKTFHVERGVAAFSPGSAGGWPSANLNFDGDLMTEFRRYHLEEQADGTWGIDFWMGELLRHGLVEISPDGKEAKFVFHIDISERPEHLHPPAREPLAHWTLRRIDQSQYQRRVEEMSKHTEAIRVNIGGVTVPLTFDFAVPVDQDQANDERAFSFYMGFLR